MSYRGFWSTIHQKVAVGERTGFLAADPAGLRDRQFAAGRRCALEALGALACPEAEIARGADREPVWPAGLVGSISHTDDYCVAAVVRREHVASIGIDAEKTNLLSTRVVARICDEAERNQMLALPEKLGALFPLVLFSAKESLFKCLFQLGRLGPMGFRDASLRIEWSQRRIFVQRLADGVSAARCGALHGRFAISERHVMTYVAVTHRGAA
jgi:4'-phosphopantetheinyl transferase EntD